MKKKILLGIFALAIIASVGFGMNKSVKSDANLSDLAMANIEALAFYENGGDFEIICGQYQGACWKADRNLYINCGEYTLVHPCKFTGYMSDYCVSPCR